MKIIGISGSLRTGSYNSKLLVCAKILVPPDVHLNIHDISHIPFYNADLDTEQKPQAVHDLLNLFAEADGVLFATPEYNYSISGVLKNTLDWVSRPAYQSVLALKPVGIVSASKGLAGGARAQLQLRHVLGATLSPVYPSPEFLLPSADGAFDALGNLQDAKSRQRLERYIDGFCQWIAEMGKSRP